MLYGREKKMNELAFISTERTFESIISRMTYANKFLDTDDLFDSPDTKWIIKTANRSYKSLIKNSSHANQEADFDSFIDFSGEIGPVIQNDLTDSNDSEVQELILRIKTTSSIPDRAGIANRLLTLFHYSKEEDPDFIGIRANSLKSFYNFLRSYSQLKRPAITLTPDNNIYASWRGDEGRVFSIHFLPDSDVNFVIFTPNKRRPERKTRTAGKTTFDMLMETEASAYNLYDWISK